MHAFMAKDPARSTALAALKLSPLEPQRYYYDSLAATAHLTAGQNEKALALAQRSLRDNRTHTSTLRVMAVAQWCLGLHEDARKTVQRLLELEPDLTIARYLKRTPSAPYQIGKEIASALKAPAFPMKQQNLRRGATS